jgi:hypothetical protein
MMMVASSQAQFPLSRAKQLGNAVDSAKMQIVHKVAVPGAPFDVVVVGAAGENH